MIFAYLIASGENILINIIMYIAHSLYSLIICNYPDMFWQSTIYQSGTLDFILTDRFSVFVFTKIAKSYIEDYMEVVVKSISRRVKCV